MPPLRNCSNQKPHRGAWLVLGVVWLALIGTVSIGIVFGGETQTSSKEPSFDTKTRADQKDDGATKDNVGKAKGKDSKGNEPKRDEAKKNDAKAASANPSQREAAALALAREHHVELIELLERLKSQKPKEYQLAIEELWRASERLANFRVRDCQRYELELRAWKIDSRVRLLAAKLSMEQDPALEQELKSALAERADVRLQLKTSERDKVKSRLETLNAEIDKLTGEREQQIQQAFDKLLRGAAKARPKAGASKSPADDKVGAKPAAGTE